MKLPSKAAAPVGFDQIGASSGRARNDSKSQPRFDRTGQRGSHQDQKHSPPGCELGLSEEFASFELRTVPTHCDKLLDRWIGEDMLREEPILLTEAELNLPV